ncbi:short-chain alcohol dehydrogenase [Leptospira ryugenii]|uniref:Short-chain alcohol dehydrogenase n=1 Tax=Leptospira ryugenii TaxID=1917863 RepID=A0A2P2E591_9LEPT|nr:SDR family NAD(P)-dependent oxidoreductase [Leptospira ryugenii]GBF52037.1 short-chain alcohol dehydrogenase [Leptospira ryugenii]
MESFKDKTVLVTGGTQGMGLVVAQHFLRAGAIVFITGRDKEKGKHALGEIIDPKHRLHYLPCDVTNEIQVKEVVNTIIETHGKLDIAFNNAGITSKSHLPLAEFTAEEWKHIIDVNLTGLFYSMKYEIESMLLKGKGVIINNSSVAGLVSLPKQGAYCASKSAVIALTESASIDYAESGIRINAIAPGPILGGMNDLEKLKANPERTAKKLSLTAMKRMGTAEEIAETILWIASDKASFLTGACIPVDGGFSAGKW